MIGVNKVASMSPTIMGMGTSIRTHDASIFDRLGIERFSPSSFSSLRGYNDSVFRIVRFPGEIRWSEKKQRNELIVPVTWEITRIKKLDCPAFGEEVKLTAQKVILLAIAFLELPSDIATSERVDILSVKFKCEDLKNGHFLVKRITLLPEKKDEAKTP